ncbi:MAG TPA: SusE domain-containing protein [Flavobacterium sp.]|jgi:hypothetical protein
MKNITKSLIALFGIVAFSCTTDDVEDRPVIQAVDAPVLMTPDMPTYTLVIENASLQAERFVWTPANFGGDVVVDYVVQMDSIGGNFQDPVILGATAGGTNISISTENLNAKAIELGGEPTVNAEYQVRVISSVGSVEPMYSNIVTISVTPYQAFVPAKHLYVVGTATEFGFDNNAGNMPLFRDNANQNKFYLRAYFNAGELKFLETLGAWQPQYGTNDGVTLAVSNPGDPGAITIATAGYYDIEVDIDEMTFSVTPFDEAGAMTFSTIGIIGAATPGGWDTDTDLTNSTLNPHIWKITGLPLTAAAVKFRANNSWDLPGNWGGGTPVTGVMAVNGSDFQGVNTDGTYTVWFNDLDNRYIFIPE